VDGPGSGTTVHLKFCASCSYRWSHAHLVTVELLNWYGAEGIGSDGTFSS
jgi:hypothetical protein